jgi:hypothetical protein
MFKIPDPDEEAVQLIPSRLYAIVLAELTPDAPASHINPFQAKHLMLPDVKGVLGDLYHCDPS